MSCVTLECAEGAPKLNNLAFERARAFFHGDAAEVSVNGLILKRETHWNGWDEVITVNENRSGSMLQHLQFSKIHHPWSSLRSLIGDDVPENEYLIEEFKPQPLQEGEVPVRQLDLSNDACSDTFTHSLEIYARLFNVSIVKVDKFSYRGLS